MNQIKIFAKNISVVIGQKYGLRPPTSPIGEKIRYNKIIAEKRFTETGITNSQGVRSTTFLRGYTQATGRGFKYPITSIIVTSNPNKIA